MKKFMRQLVDSKDSDVEMHAILLCLGVVGLVGLAAYHVIALHNAFDPSAYGQGLGCLLAGGGAAAWGQGLQRRSEKGDNPDEPA